MARQKDIMTRLADAGEGAFARMAGSPATARFVESIGGMREKVEELQRRVRGIEELERRIAKLEKQVADLAKPKPSRTATTRKAPTRKAPPGKPSSSSSAKKPPS